jgi:hypothetical protein
MRSDATIALTRASIVLFRLLGFQGDKLTVPSDRTSAMPAVRMVLHLPAGSAV